MRRGLAGHGLRVPLFDFACLLYYQHTGGLNSEKLKALLPAEEMDLVAAVVDLGLSLGHTTAVGAVIKAVLVEGNKYLGWPVNEKWTIWLQKRGLNKERVAEIMRLDPERELVAKLPELFAEDLNAAMRDEGAPPRVVLFFDTHESLWGDRATRELAGDRIYQRDEWLRCLLASLEPKYGIVVIVAGREPPRWSVAYPAKIPKEYVELVPVEHLTDAYALRYLASAKVGTVEMQECLREYARVGGPNSSTVPRLVCRCHTGGPARWQAAPSRRFSS
ncbi:MAG: hypothetical protein H0X37_12430 [Herpetosiphonaceae bacterium]|nr:hypothetical protein [Herpetosiphonaceae bacterium]